MFRKFTLWKHFLALSVRLSLAAFFHYLTFPCQPEMWDTISLWSVSQCWAVETAGDAINLDRELLFILSNWMFCGHLRQPLTSVILHGFGPKLSVWSGNQHHANTPPNHLLPSHLFRQISDSNIHLGLFKCLLITYLYYFTYKDINKRRIKPKVYLNAIYRLQGFIPKLVTLENFEP